MRQLSRREIPVCFVPQNADFPDYIAWINAQNSNAATRIPAGQEQTRYYAALALHVQSHPGAVVQVNYDIGTEVLRFLTSVDKFGVKLAIGDQTIELRNKSLSLVQPHSARKIVLENCVVTELYLNSVTPFVALKDCHIELLTIRESVGMLTIQGGSIRKLRFGPSGRLTGPVRLHRVQLPTSNDEIQSLRTLRAELLRIHNVAPAGVARAAEMRITRNEEDWPTWTASCAYDEISEYGNSSTRALGWALAPAAFNFFLLWGYRTTELAVADPVGWQRDLVGDGPIPTFLRAGVLTVGQIANPLGIVGRTPLVVTTSTWTAGISTVLCFVATAALAFFVLAIRRNVKLDA
jgi:hypothetical protein